MKELKIYLLYSLNDRPYERDALGNFVRKLNDIFRDKQQKIYIRMVQCEDATGKEDLYGAQLFVTLSCPGGTDFDTALKHFQTKKQPAIMTFFRQDISENVAKFRDQLADLHGHYFTEYTDVENVQHKLLMQLMLAEPELAVTVEGGAVRVGGAEVLSLNNVPMFANNRAFQELKEEFADCYEEYLEAKQKSLDVENDPKVTRKRKYWEKARDAVQEMERQLFHAALSFERQAGKMAMTPRQKAAYAAMEQGDPEKANAILDLEEIMADIQHKAAISNVLQSELCAHIDELLQKIAVLQSQPGNAQRTAQIADIYRTAIKLEETHNLPKRAMLEYLLRLDGPVQYRKEKADIAQRYVLYAQLTEEQPVIAQAYYLQGYHCHMAWMDEPALEAAQKAKELYAALAADGSGMYLKAYAEALANVGSCLAVCGQGIRPEIYRETLQVYLELEKRYPGKYLANVCNYYSNLGEAYCGDGTAANAQAEEMFIKAAEFELKDALINPDQNRAWHISRLLSYYEATDPDGEKVKTAQARYIKRLKTHIEEAPKYNVLLYKFYRSNSIHYKTRESWKEAWENIQKAISVLEKCSGAGAWETIHEDLGTCYGEAAEIALEKKDDKLAEENCLKALSIWKRLDKTMSIYGTKERLAEIYLRAGRLEEAEAILTEACPHYYQCLKEYHSWGSAISLSQCHLLLSDLYTKTDRPEAAGKSREKAEIYQQLADDWMYGRRDDQGLPGPLPE